MSETLTRENSRLRNEMLFDKLASRDMGLIKEAEDAVNDFTRTKMREDGFFRKIMPPVQVTNEDLVRQIHTDKPVLIVDREPDSPAAASIPFGSLPINIYIRGQRYPVMLDRIVTPRFTKDVDELRTWIMDIRQVLSDNAIKDMLAEEDGKFMSGVNAVLVGAGLPVPTSGTVQWQNISGGINRDSLWDAMKIMPSTPSNLEVHTCLVNNITIKEVCKFGRDEMGGDFSQDIMKNGWSEQNFMGVRWIITIKKTLVETNAIYMFADPNFIGKHYTLEDVTMAIRREFFLLDFFAYETNGGAIGHTSGIAKATYV